MKAGDTIKIRDDDNQFHFFVAIAVVDGRIYLSKSTQKVEFEDYIDIELPFFESGFSLSAKLLAVKASSIPVMRSKGIVQYSDEIIPTELLKRFAEKYAESESRNENVVSILRNEGLLS